MAINVLVIGAGPAGLAVAACLADRGVPYVVYERGEAPLAALRQVDPEMQLLTPAALSRLPGMSMAGTARYPRFGELVQAFERWRLQRDIQVVTGVNVEKLSRPNDFLLSYRRNGETGEARASHVVNATGIITHPKLPADFDPGAVRFKWCHSIGVRTADIAAARRLLVVGAGTSGAEVLERWLDVRRPGDRAWLSIRRPIHAAPDKILGVDIHYFSWLVEHLPGRFAGHRIAPRRDPIIGRRIIPALRSQDIVRVEPVAGYQQQTVTLTDGAQLEPDLVVFATGFQYRAPHLGDLVERDSDGWPILSGSESTRAPGLYLLGVRFGRTIASPYLRGISRDARAVARKIARQL